MNASPDMIEADIGFNTTDGINTTNRGLLPMVRGRVSIIIPAYNNVATIAETLESCLAQTYRDIEIIVVNDGSKDATGAVLDGFGARIKTIHQANGGIANARNIGLSATTGEFVAWMNADDIAEPSRIAAQQSVLAMHADIALVSSNFSAFTVDVNMLTPNFIGNYYRALSRLGGLANIYTRRLSGINQDVINKDSINSGFTASAGVCRESLLSGNFIHPPTVMVRRNAFAQIGFFDTSLLYSSDYDWILRASRLGAFAFIDQSPLRYRLSEGQISRKASAKIPIETIKIIKKIGAADPALAARHAVFLKGKVAECLLTAAEAAVDSSRTTALKYWAKSLLLKPTVLPHITILTKILLPASAHQIAKTLARKLGLLRESASHT